MNRRNRLASMAVGAATAVVLIFTWLANANPSQRPDVFYLDIVLVVHLAFAIFWTVRTRAPRLITLTYGLALIVVGFVSLAGPISNGGPFPGQPEGMGSLIPWAWISMTTAGLLMIASALLDSRSAAASRDAQEPTPAD